MPDGVLGFEGERGEIIPLYDGLCYFTIILLKKIYLFKIIELIISFYFKKILTQKF